MDRKREIEEAVSSLLGSDSSTIREDSNDMEPAVRVLSVDFESEVVGDDGEGNEWTELTYDVTALIGGNKISGKYIVDAATGDYVPWEGYPENDIFAALSELGQATGAAWYEPRYTTAAHALIELNLDVAIRSRIRR